VKQKKTSTINKIINWNLFRSINPQRNYYTLNSIRTIAEIEISVKKLTNDIVNVARIETPSEKNMV